MCTLKTPIWCFTNENSPYVSQCVYNVSVNNNTVKTVKSWLLYFQLIQDFTRGNDFMAVTGTLSYSCLISHVWHAFVNFVEAAGSGGSVASKPSSWANVSLGLFYGALCAFVPDRLAQWNDLILKDTPSDFKAKPRAPALCLVCSQCLSGGVARSVILLVFFGRTGLECKYEYLDGMKHVIPKLDCQQDITQCPQKQNSTDCTICIGL